MGFDGFGDLFTHPGRCDGVLLTSDDVDGDVEAAPDFGRGKTAGWLAVGPVGERTASHTTPYRGFALLVEAILKDAEFMVRDVTDPS